MIPIDTTKPQSRRDVVWMRNKCVPIQREPHGCASSPEATAISRASTIGKLLDLHLDLLVIVVILVVAFTTAFILSFRLTNNGRWCTMELGRRLLQLDRHTIGQRRRVMIRKLAGACGFGHRARQPNRVRVGLALDTLTSAPMRCGGVRE